MLNGLNQVKGEMLNGLNQVKGFKQSKWSKQCKHTHHAHQRDLTVIILTLICTDRRDHE